MKKNLRKGQTSLEYMLILGIVVAVIVIFGKGIKGKITGLMDKVFGDAQTAAGGTSEGG
jgi:Flp pilus assembly pilin Flp